MHRWLTRALASPNMATIEYESAEHVFGLQSSLGRGRSRAGHHYWLRVDRVRLTPPESGRGATSTADEFQGNPQLRVGPMPPRRALVRVCSTALV